MIDNKKITKMIKEEYEVKEDSNFLKLKKLDRKAKMPSIIFAYTFGVIGALVMGFGMSIVLGSILANMAVLGYILGGVGIMLVSINYPIYKAIYEKGKNKYKEQIISLSNEILES